MRGPDFDAPESHGLYLQLLGATNTSKNDFETGSAWDAANSAAVGRVTALGGQLWKAQDHDFVIAQSTSQTFRQWYAANKAIPI